MAYVFYIAAIVGAVGLYFVLPHGRSKPKVGGLLALASLVGLFVYLLLAIPGEASRQSIYYYIFTFISAAASVRVISHPRPVYSALYFVLVVLSTAGMLLLLAAEFMAFAMVIIYGGAILITYMFVIMLATQPQTEAEPETAAVYDRTAREPIFSVAMGFALIAAMTTVIFEPPTTEVEPGQPEVAAAMATSIPRMGESQAWAASRQAAVAMQGKFDVQRHPDRAQTLRRILLQRGLIESGEYVADVEVTPEAITAMVMVGDPAEGRTRARPVPIDEDIYTAFIGNIDQIGLALFQGHTLGIELAAVVLLLSMVGAIVIARRQVPEVPGPGVPDPKQLAERGDARVVSQS